ncbi:unnamed protein product [Prorocentrum cordatum]|uniref:IBR domain-containing protein n=1 Tax=Prorocentrum cordatum TaxID=2364126 RepID=A0ABN9THI7_9DINO|nr:unnamed protein product [Polarella glacialis]
MRCCCRGGTSPGEFKPPAPGERYDAVAAGWEEQEEIVPREGEDEEQRQLREMLGEALGIEVRQCPFCSVACVKDNPDDCDHIHCVCGREFCWQCLADREVIFHHGNHYHRPGCPYRFDFQDQDRAEAAPEVPPVPADGPGLQAPQGHGPRAPTKVRPRRLLSPVGESASAAIRAISDPKSLFFLTSTPPFFLMPAPPPYPCPSRAEPAAPPCSLAAPLPHSAHASLGGAPRGAARPLPFPPPGAGPRRSPFSPTRASSSQNCPAPGRPNGSACASCSSWPPRRPRGRSAGAVCRLAEKED